MNEFHDERLGTIRVKRHPNARHIRFRISPKGVMTATAPPRTSLGAIKRTATSCRDELLAMLDEHRNKIRYYDGQEIGKSHSLRIVTSEHYAQPVVVQRDRAIVATVPREQQADDIAVQNAIQLEVIKVLKKESKVYLERRLRHLALRLDYRYHKIRYTHTGTRWGSCSSTGTISLNIALMMLPLELIDYVLIHELCHTREMNHSTAFWNLVRAADPSYLIHRRSLKQYSPAL